ncbi:hypothetical protein LSO9J_240003 [Candidatus Liberibacter solanacearum]
MLRSTINQSFAGGDIAAFITFNNMESQSSLLFRVLNN